MSGKNLKNAFIEAFEPTMINQGFLRKGKIFHRIVNKEIAQLLSYYKFSGPEFTIQFSIIPLCSGLEFSLFMDDSRLCEEFDSVDSWEYEYGTDEYIKYMPEALKLSKEYLFPLFDSAINYATYLKLCSPHSLGHQFYMTNMVLGEYELCQKSREALFKQRVEACQKNWGTNFHIVPSRREKNEREIHEYQRIKEAMDKNDRETIEQYINEQEQKSLKSYIKTFTTPKKYENYLNTGQLPFEFVYIGIVEPKYRYETEEAISELRKDLNIPYDPFSQDFAYENAKSEDIEIYLGLYNKIDNEDKKFVLMQMLIASIEDQENEGKFTHYWNIVKNLIEKDFLVHEYTVWYWCLYEGQHENYYGKHMENAWRITPYMRELWHKIKNELKNNNPV
ncbi:MAG: hypothetical protein LBU83_13845 [Bacteroidales bacterium]|jgi:hypothetical protein|nr:hypothetical protein [Bacteroidales bacterium]